MTRPSRRVADYAPSTLEFSADLVLAAAVEEAVQVFQNIAFHDRICLDACNLTEFRDGAQATLLAAASAAQLILDRSAS